MNKSESITALAKSLSAFQSEMDAIGFDSKNPFLKNSYASLGALIAGSKGALAKNGLAVTQLVTTDGELVGVETILMHASGEWLGSQAYLPTGVEKGKSDAQVAGSVITYLRRYSYAAILGIYADEDTDGEKRPAIAAVHKDAAHTEPKAAVAGPAIKMTLEDACKVKDSDGGLYMDKTVELLATRHNSISKKMKAGGYSGDEQAEMDAKVTAIKILIAAKNSGEVK